jgi:hypothetical protein
MTGGSFEPTGGFWALAPGPAVLVADPNCDGAANFGDINPFGALLTGVD